MSELLTGLHSRVERIISGKIQVLTMPWQGLARASKALKPGTVTMLCGDGGASKTFVVLQQLLHSFALGHPVAYLALEEDLEFYLFRLLAMQTGVPGITDEDWIVQHPDTIQEMMVSHREFLEEIATRIVVDSDKPMYHKILTWMRRKINEGCKLLIVDPVTAAGKETGRGWEEDADFIQQAKRMTALAEVSLVLVTHPKEQKQGARPSMHQLAGSQAFPRFCQTIIWLEFQPTVKETQMLTPFGAIPATYNRVFHLLKARNAKGTGGKFGAYFDSKSLTINESGLMIRKEKGQKK